MSDPGLLLGQVAFTNKTFWRNPASAFFTFVFPLMFLVIFNLLFGNEETEIAGRTVRSSTFFIPAIVALSVVNACFTNIAMGISFSRDQGLLKRVRGTPLPAWAFLASRIAHASLVAVLLVAIVVAAGALFYGVSVPDNTMPGFLLTLVVGAAAFCALGLAMTAVIPNADASPAIVNATILPLLFISDVFVPLEDAPPWLLILGDVFPIKHLSEALQAAFNPFATGTGFEWGHLAVMAAWGIAGLLLAIRFFSWEPRR